MKPLVSVIVPVYNSGKYLAETLDSILASTYKSIEVILINDGSTDSSADICKLYQQKDARIFYLEQENAGVVVARNNAIKRAKGEYIVPVDSDDCIESSYIEKAVSIMEKEHNIGIVYCEAEFFGARSGKWDLPPYSLSEMLCDNIIFVTALFRRSDWEKVGGYKQCMNGYLEDYDFWLSIIEMGRKVYRIPEVLFFYRIRKGSRSKLLAENYNQQVNGALMIYSRHKKLYADNIDIVFQSVLPRYIEENAKLRKQVDFIKRFIPINKTLKDKIKKWLNLK